MPLFLRTQVPQRREKLILGGALTHRIRPAQRRRQRRPQSLAVKRPVKRPTKRRSVPVKRLVQRRRRPSKKSVAAKLFGKATSKAKGMLSQSRQLKRAAKGALSQLAPQMEHAAKRVGRQLVATGISEVGNHLMRRKRPLEEKEEEHRPMKQARRTGGPMSRIGYRGQAIHRGAGTKQTRGNAFLF